MCWPGMHSKYSFNKYLCAKTHRLYARLLLTCSSYSSGGNRQVKKQTLLIALGVGKEIKLS